MQLCVDEGNLIFTDGSENTVQNCQIFSELKSCSLENVVFHLALDEKQLKRDVIGPFWPSSVLSESSGQSAVGTIMPLFLLSASCWLPLMQSSAPSGAEMSHSAWVYNTIEGAGLLLGIVPSANTHLSKPPTTLLEKENYSAALHKRRKRLKEIRTGFKRFLAFIFSQIGLSLLVIGYTIIGGLIFRAVELENEKAVKIRGKQLRESLADQFSGEIIRELRFQITSLNSLHDTSYRRLNDDEKLFGIQRRVKREGLAKKLRRRRSEEKDFAKLRQWLYVIAYTLRHKTRQELHSSLRTLTKMMDAEGWSGEDSMDDLKWSWEGSILFAVTVITTIGYGHAVPKTNAGKFLTIIYALVGIPLVFLYLTNIGDYLASLFRILYARICRRCCEGSCVNRVEPQRKLSIFNASREIDLTQRRDFLLDESLHRNNINVIRRIGIKPEKRETSKGEEMMADCLGINVFSNDSAIEKDKNMQMEMENMKKNSISEGTKNDSHRKSLKIPMNPSQSFWLNSPEANLESISEPLPQCSPASPTSPTKVPDVSPSACPDVSSPSEAPVNKSAVLKHSGLSQEAKTVFEVLKKAGPTSTRNAGSQTVLQAAPNEELNYRSLCKSFVLGHYLRSYRRERRHQKKQLRKKRSRVSPMDVGTTSTTEDLSWRVEPHRSPPANHLELSSSSQNIQSPTGNTIHPFHVKSDPSMVTKCSGQNLAEDPPSASKMPLQKSCSLQTTQPGGKVTIRRPQSLIPKSRLSILSSLASSSTDLTVRLSYYSDETALDAERVSPDNPTSDDDFNGEDISKVTVPISLSIMIMTTYILIGAIVFCIWEDANYLKWSYFCFVTLSTIGFGDIVPGTKIDSTNPKEKLIIITMYVAVGLSVFAMCFKLMQEEVVSKFKWLARYISDLKRKVRKHRVERPKTRSSSSAPPNRATSAVAEGAPVSLPL